MRKLLLIILCTSALVACNNKQLYSKFHTISPMGWQQDSILDYTIDIADSTALYDLIIVLRHTNKYPYQNFWMFVETSYGNTLLQRDTIEGYLADNYGRWIGNGINTYTLPLIYNKEMSFPCSGKYTFSIQQGMRTEYLQGITDVGLQVVKHNGKE